MEIIYRANDGTEFEFETDCAMHENMTNYLCNTKHFIAFNEDFIPYDITPDTIEMVLEQMIYFICLTNEAVVACEQLGVYVDDDIKQGIFYGWEIDNTDTWEALSDVYMAYKEKMERLTQMEKTLWKKTEACGE